MDQTSKVKGAAAPAPPAANPRRSRSDIWRRRFLYASLAFLAVVVFLFSFAEDKKNGPACKYDLQCWAEKNRLNAMTRCRAAIDKLARFQSKWTDGWTAPIFSRSSWISSDSSNLRYFGDELQFQNGFGAWSPMIYQCDYNPSTDSVIDVAVEQGRL